MYYFDPPSGWQYGFPALVSEDDAKDEDALAQILRKAGYPEKDIPLALRASRFWFVSTPTSKEQS